MDDSDSESEYSNEEEGNNTKDQDEFMNFNHESVTDIPQNIAKPTSKTKLNKDPSSQANRNIKPKIPWRKESQKSLLIAALFKVVATLKHL